jgi:hypothetical protein
MELDRFLPKESHYARRAELLDSGAFIVHCQLPAQSRLLAKAEVLYMDKTFKRSSTVNEVEINTYVPVPT